MNANKQKAIDAALAQIRKEIPEVVIDKYENYGGSVDVETVSTGSLAADKVMGGGFAVGRVNCIVGHTSAGKTTLALTTVAELQKKNPDAVVLYVDSECAIDPKYAKALGVNMDKVYLVQPDCGEDGYKAAELFISSGAADLVIIDSIAAMIPRAMFDVELGDQAQIGMGARLDSQGISRIFAKAHKTKTTVILINQWKKAVKVNAYDRTDGISGNYYMPGGETIKFYFSQLIEVQRVGKIYEKDDDGIEQLSSNQTRIRVLKNKIAPPGRESDFFITFGVGVDRVQEVIELGILSGDIIRSGRSLYSVAGDEDKTFNGRPKFVAYLRENPDIVQRLSDNIQSSYLSNHHDDIHISTDTDVLEVDDIVEE